MPSVMRRSTRVFVPKSVVKDSDVVRILRSGKLMAKDVDGQHVRRNSDEWFQLYDDSGDEVAPDEWKNAEPEPEKKAPDAEMTDLDVEEKNKMSTSDEGRRKRFGAVYNRKRRRSKDKLPEFNREKDPLYGSQYVRKKRRIGESGSSSSGGGSQELVGNSEPNVVVKGYFRKKRKSGDSRSSSSSGESQESVGNSESIVGVSRRGRSKSRFVAIVELSPRAASRFTCFLVSVLKFMRQSRMSLSGLAAFMFDEPIVGVFSQNGIHFWNDSLSIISLKNDIPSFGYCEIFGAQDFMPLFSLDYSAIPLSFTGLHLSVLRRSLCLPDVLKRFLMEMLNVDRGVPDSDKCVSRVPTDATLSEDNDLVSRKYSPTKRRVGYLGGEPGLLLDSLFARYGPNSKSIRKKRSSMRTKKMKNPSPMGFPVLSQFNVNNPINAILNSDPVHQTLNSHLVRGSDGQNTLPSPGFQQRQSKGARKSPCSDIKEAKATLVVSNQTMNLSCCSASVLVLESDRCHRLDGVKVMLECFSNVWYLVVKKQGVTKYTHKAQEAVKPHAFNLYTHALIWTGEEGWRLEFSERQDWETFKELHKECVSRNIQAQNSKTIPVPGVCEVPKYVERERATYVRPDSYITVHGDEVARALAKKTANYDIDLADEEWLAKLNNSLHEGNDGPASEHVSVEKFEELIDVFERTAYHNPGSISDESKAVILCSNIGRRDVIAAVYQYWHKKRKQKRGVLIRVFQRLPPKKSQEAQDRVLRKRRSFKKQPSVARKGKDRLDLEALAAEKEQEVTKAAQKVEAALIRVKETSELYTFKRRRAEKLMETANKAIYKAVMASRIAELAELSENPYAPDAMADGAEPAEAPEASDYFFLT